MNSVLFRRYLDVVSICVWVFTVFLLTAGRLDTNNMSPLFRWMFDISSALLSVIAIPGALVLWLTMMWYFAARDFAPRSQKVFSFMLLVLGLGFGASIYWLWKRNAKHVSGAGGRPLPRAVELLPSIAKYVAIGSWIAVAIIILLSIPNKTLLPWNVLSWLAFIAAPFFVLGQLLWLLALTFARGMRIGH